jgi:rhodanese-related sulfurtransferase
MSEATASMFETLDPLRLQELCASAEPPQLIDVRNAAEFARGSIAAARHVELAALTAAVDELDPHAPIVLICLSGARSAQGCLYLAKRGFTRVYNLDGGLASWVRSGLPLIA